MVSISMSIVSGVAMLLVRLASYNTKIDPARRTAFRVHVPCGGFRRTTCCVVNKNIRDSDAVQLLPCVTSGVESGVDGAESRELPRRAPADAKTFINVGSCDGCGLAPQSASSLAESLDPARVRASLDSLC